MNRVQIIMGGKSGKILSVIVEELENSYFDEHGYLHGDLKENHKIVKAEFKKYDELTKNLKPYYIGYYRQRVYNEFAI